MLKRKEISFSPQGEEEELSLRINVQKDWLRDHTSWAPCEIEMKIKGILKSWFWISLHWGTLSIFCSRIQGYMLSLMNEVNPWLLLPLCVLYEIQNRIFQQVEVKRKGYFIIIIFFERLEQRKVYLDGDFIERLE